MLKRHRINVGVRKKRIILSSNMCNERGALYLCLSIMQCRLTLTLLKWRIWRVPNNASRWDVTWRLKG